MRLVVLFLMVFMVTACDHPNDPTGRTQTGALGESSTPVIFGNQEVASAPNYDERVVFAITNRFRVNTDTFDIRDMDGNIIPPNAPMTYQIGMAEAGKWQGQHALQYSCFCPQDPMAEPAAWNSCCEAGFVNGVAQCIGPISSCDGEGSMEQEDRWNVLNRGPGQIGTEFYFTTNDPSGGTYPVALDFLLNGAIGVAFQPQNNAYAPAVTSVQLPPDNCAEPDSSCGDGQCLDPESGEPGCEPGGLINPDCIGTCSGGPRNGEACIIPEPLPPECMPENYPTGYYWTFGIGSTNDPTPPIADGIHLNFAGANMGDPAVLAVISHYYDPTGDPRSFQLVLDGQCIDMELEFTRPGSGGDDMGADAGDAGMVDAGMGDFPSHGDSWITSWTQGDLNAGCYRYILAATDSEGFVHTYPTLGSLGMAVTPDGIVTGDVDGCPIWEPTRPATTCLPAADQCNDGDTRLCYTGREGTQGKGLCTSGTEACERGRWAGVCENEVLPEQGETCGDQVDNNCNGFVDEGCPVLVPPVDMGQVGTPDAGTDDEDAGPTEDTGTGGETPKEDDGCCATTADRPNHAAWWTLIAALALVAIRRRKN